MTFFVFILFCTRIFSINLADFNEHVTGLSLLILTANVLHEFCMKKFSDFGRF
jgi:hypothetical protein